nr:type II toxin-antitoxin system RelE/ParE family toxin [Sphingomonas sp. PAMC 26605]
MRVFKKVWFRKFARKENISDAAFCEAVARIEAGLIDADLGDGLMKQRVARPGAGKSSGYRTVLALRAATGAVSLSVLPRVRGTISTRTVSVL